MAARTAMNVRAVPRPGWFRAWPLIGVAVVAALALLAATLSWSARQLTRQAEERAGLTFTVFANPDRAGAPILMERSSDISLAFLDANPNLPERDYSARWEGFWDVPPGPLDLFGGGDDELHVWVDGEQVVERSFERGMGTVSQLLSVPAGLHHLRIEYVQRGGGAHLNLQWAPADQEPRSFEPRVLFPGEPDRESVFLARLSATRERVARLMWIVCLAAFVLLVVIPASLRGWRESAARGAAVLLLGLGAVVVLRTVGAWSGGLDPQSLWADDLVWATLVKAPSISMMLSVPAHAPPGFFLALRVLHGMLPDPEWSLQVLPLLCGLAAGPVMALAAWRFTQSAGLAVLAVSLTVLNPLLAHYSIFVKQYSLDFLITASLLAAAGRLLLAPDIDLRYYARVAVLSGLAILLSITSALMSAPLVALAAWRLWRARPDRWRSIAMWAGVYGSLFVAAYLSVRSRTNPRVRQSFIEGFMPVDSLSAAWGFLSLYGRRMLETGLPSWKETVLTNPETVWWPLPLLAIGLVWLVARPATRLAGVLIVGFYGAFLFASATFVYPMGTGRPDIFAFPVAILLFAAGVHGVTSWLPWREVFRAAAGIAVALFAIAWPIQPLYLAVDDVRLMRRLLSEGEEGRALILSPTATFLAAYYGPWPIVVSQTPDRPNATNVEVIRPATLHLRPDVDPTGAVASFVQAEGKPPLWFVAFRTATEEREQTLAALEAAGYLPEQVERTERGRLYRALRPAGSPRPDTPASTTTHTPPR